MTDPTETAAEALRDMPRDDGMVYHSAALARVALASLVQHRDDLARVLAEHEPFTTASAPSTRCRCGAWVDGHAQHQADAVLRYLAGGAS